MADKQAAGSKRSLFWVAFFGIGFWVVVVGYWTHKSNERQAAAEAAKPIWNTVRRIPVVADCRETHATQSSRYSGDVAWMLEAKSGKKRTMAVLLQTSEEAQKWLDRSIEAITKNPGRGDLYTPPSTVMLMVDDDHVIPNRGTSSSLSDTPRPSYPVVCDPIQRTE